MTRLKTKHRNCPLCGSDDAKLFKTEDSIDIVRCSKCQMVFVDVDDKIIYELNQYDEGTLVRYYQTEPIYTVAYYDDLLLRIASKAKKTKLKILEFGCGSGMFMRRARMKGIEVSGIDYSPYSQKAKELFGLDIFVGDLNDCNFSENDFDVVISHSTHEHLIDPAGISRMLMRYLKPGGIFIISGVPNFNTITIKVFRNFWNNGPRGHVNHFEVQSLKKLFGLLNVEPMLVKSYGWNVWYINHLLNKLRRKRAKPTELKAAPAGNNDLMLNYEKRIPTNFQKLLSKTYCNFVFPTIGQSIEAWGIKKAE